MRTLTRIPPSFFAIPFGLAGLAVVWRVMAGSYGSPAAISDGLFIAAAVVWLPLVAGSLWRVGRHPRLVFGELRDPVLSPFWALPWIVGMQLAIGFQPHGEATAKVVFVVFFVATILFGGWVTGQWIAGDLDETKLHPGYYFPTVAGCLIAADGAAGFGLSAAGWMSFGIGVVFWLMLGSLVLNRLMFVKMLPGPLVPTLAIELAPPALGGSAYFALHGTVPNAFAYGLAGYGVLMVLVQLRLLPVYGRLMFSPGFWAFTFPWTAAAAYALRWLHIEKPAGQSVYAGLAAGAVSLLVAAIAARSLLAIARGQFGVS